jgi:glycolate oxidase FAD binding subunit
VTAAQNRRPLRLRGGGTKDFYGATTSGEILDTRACAGIVAYEPTELGRDRTLRHPACRTRIHARRQRTDARLRAAALSAPRATLGGCVAAGLSGPRRASAGALRDFVLGARVVDGQGRLLSFGGRVMKNVAGYDVARLLAGSLGTLGVIVEVSLKVLPKPVEECTLRLEMPEGRAIEAMNRWAGQPLPISATVWQSGVLAVRLSGAASALREAASRLGGERRERAVMQAFWEGIREQTDPFFAGADPLWRVSVPTMTPPLALAGRTADRVERRAALAEDERQRLRGPRGHAQGGRPRDDLSRVGSLGGSFFGAFARGCALAPRAESRVRSGGNPQPGPARCGALGLGCRSARLAQRARRFGDECGGALFLHALARRVLAHRDPCPRDAGDDQRESR